MMAKPRLVAQPSLTHTQQAVNASPHHGIDHEQPCRGESKHGPKQAGADDQHVQKARTGWSGASPCTRTRRPLGIPHSADVNRFLTFGYGARATLSAICARKPLACCWSPTRSCWHRLSRVAGQPARSSAASWNPALQPQAPDKLERMRSRCARVPVCALHSTEGLGFRAAWRWDSFWRHDGEAWINIDRPRR